MLGAGTDLGTVIGNDWEMKPIALMLLLCEVAGIIRRIECARLRLVEKSILFSDSILSLCAAVSFPFYRCSSIEAVEENEIDFSHHADRPITNRAILTYAKGVTLFSGFGLSSANPNPNRWEPG